MENWDDNTRGLGLGLRFAGAILPLPAFFAVFEKIEHQLAGVPISHDVLSRVFRVLAFLWAWPYSIYEQQPLSFGALALAGVLIAGILVWRRDWKGAVTVLGWCFFWGWLIAAIIGGGQGN